MNKLLLIFYLKKKKKIFNSYLSEKVVNGFGVIFFTAESMAIKHLKNEKE